MFTVGLRFRGRRRRAAGPVRFSEPDTANALRPALSQRFMGIKT